MFSSIKIVNKTSSFIKFWRRINKLIYLENSMSIYKERQRKEIKNNINNRVFVKNILYSISCVSGVPRKKLEKRERKLIFQ